jgi:PAS domain S-box-containing protein
LVKTSDNGKDRHYSREEVLKLLSAPEAHLRKIQDGLIQTKSRYTDLFNSYPPVGYLLLGKEDKIIESNNAMAVMLGYAKPDLVDKNFYSLLDDETIDSYILLKKTILGKNKKGKARIKILNSERKSVPVYIKGIRVIEDSDILKLEVLDISRLTKKDAALQESREKVELLNTWLEEKLEEINFIFDNIPIGLALLDEDLKYVRVNKIFADFNGLPIKDHLGKTIMEVSFHLSGSGKAIAKRIKRNGRPVYNAEIMGKAPHEGRTRYWREHWIPLKDAKDNIKRIIITSEEITSQKEIEKKRLESESKCMLLFKNMPQTFFLGKLVFDDKGNAIDYVILEANDNIERFLGIPKKKLMGKKIIEMFPKLSKEWLAYFEEVVLEKKSLHFEATKVDKKKNWYYVHAYHCEGDNFGAIFENITEIRKAERERKRLVQHEVQTIERKKMARELRDSISQLFFASNLLSDSIEKNLQESPNDALENIKKIRDINNNAILEYRNALLEIMSRKLPKKSLQKLITSLADFVESKTGRKIEVIIEGSHEYPDNIRNEVYRIAEEALNNVIHHSKAENIKLSLRLYPDELSLQISDNGIGFEPKKKSRKKDFGISIMKMRAKLINASLKINSSPGDGTRLTLSKKK